MLTTVVTGLGQPAQATGNDYPWQSSSPSAMSPLGFNYRNCTDFAAWRLNTQRGTTSAPWRFKWSNLASPSGNGHAIGWKDGAISRGYRVDDTPAIGAVAWWGSSRGGGLGHVAIVTGVNADGSANIEQYNAVPYAYSTQNGIRAEKYLHIADTGALSATQAISVGPSDNVTLYTPLNWSYRVRNTSEGAASIQRFTVSVRGPSGTNLDVPCNGGSGITLSAGQEWTCTATLTTGYGQAGEYTFWADWQGYSGDWHPGGLGQPRTMTLSPATTLTAAQPISIGPSNYRPKLTPLWWSYRVRNTSGGHASIQRLVVAVRGPAGDALDVLCANGTGVTLAPQQEWTCDAQLPTGYGSTGTFTFWADWLGYDGQWHTGNLGSRGTFTLH
jgi:surface antigen